MKLLQEIKVPQESVNDDTLSVVALLFSNSDFVNKGDELIELETSKAVFAIESETDGYVQYLCKEKDEVAVNSVIIRIYDEVGFDKISEKQSISPSETVSTFETIFSKKAEQYISEHNIDRAIFKNFDFVNIDDINSTLFPQKAETKSAVNPEITETKSLSKPENIDSDKVVFEELSKNKKREIEYLKAVQHENLNSVVHNFIDTEGLFESINPHLKYFKNALLPLIIYETSRLLLKFPEFNAFYANGQIALYTEINLGFAVDMEQGLKTLKIPHTTTLSLPELEQSIFDLSNKYLENKLQISDLTDITFTLTDLSSEGVNSFIPLINKNNSAILGISANDEKLHRTTLSLTFDHRVTVGKKAAIFLSELKKRIESYKFSDKKAFGNTIKCYKCLKPLTEDHNDVGFLKVITPSGEKYICQTCFNGF